jgi:hypothetical protein
VLVRKQVALTGAPVALRLKFAPTIQRDKPDSNASCPSSTASLPTSSTHIFLAPPFVLAGELEEALILTSSRQKRRDSYGTLQAARSGS